MNVVILIQCDDEWVRLHRPHACSTLWTDYWPWESFTLNEAVIAEPQVTSDSGHIYRRDFWPILNFCRPPNIFQRKKSRESERELEIESELKADWMHFLTVTFGHLFRLAAHQKLLLGVACVAVRRFVRKSPRQLRTCQISGFLSAGPKIIGTESGVGQLWETVCGGLKSSGDAEPEEAKKEDDVAYPKDLTLFYSQLLSIFTACLWENVLITGVSLWCLWLALAICWYIKHPPGGRDVLPHRRHWWLLTWMKWLGCLGSIIRVSWQVPLPMFYSFLESAHGFNNWHINSGNTKKIHVCKLRAWSSGLYGYTQMAGEQASKVEGLSISVSPQVDFKIVANCVIDEA